MYATVWIVRIVTCAVAWAVACAAAYARRAWVRSVKLVALGLARAHRQRAIHLSSPLSSLLAMTAFLLIWSPKKWPWPELPDVAKRVQTGVAVSDAWGCGFARSILPGDRVFLHRVAQEPKGIFGSGYVTRAPYEVPDAATKRGYRLCIDFVYDWLTDAHRGVVIPRDALRVHPFSVQTWDAQSSGTVIKPVAEGALEKRWRELTGARKAPAPPPT